MIFPLLRGLLALGLLAGAAIAYGVLVGAAVLVKRLARAGAKRSRGYLRLALSNLGGPGSLAPIVAPALGLGLSLMTLVAVVQTNLLGTLKETAPATAPSVIFRQIPADQTTAFDALMQEHGIDVTDGKAYRRAPVLIARVTKVNGEAVEESDDEPSEDDEQVLHEIDELGSRVLQRGFALGHQGYQGLMQAMDQVTLAEGLFHCGACLLAHRQVQVLIGLHQRHGEQRT